jgi:GDP-L-fucose synthase
MNKTSKIFVAGHKGLVGSAIVRQLKNLGYENIITKSRQELNLLRQTDVEDFFEIERPEYVFDAAAKVGGIYANDNYSADFCSCKNFRH